MTVCAFIQARMGSTRLPGKVLKDVSGKPMLQWQVERLQKAKLADHLVVVTSHDVENDPLVEFCKEVGVSFFRGDEEDVLGRFYECFSSLNIRDPDEAIVVRLTGDCPLSSPELIRDGIEEFKTLQNEGCSYLGWDERMPDGFDFEVFSGKALVTANQHAEDPVEREHVTPYLWRRPEKFKARKFFRENQLSGLRFSVDYPEDLELVSHMLDEEVRLGRELGISGVTQLIEQRPELSEVNSHIFSNEGFIKSSLASEAMQIEVGGIRTTRVGIYGAGLEKNTELCEWALKVGVNAWCFSPEAPLPELFVGRERRQPLYIVKSVDQLSDWLRVEKNEPSWEDLLKVTASKNKGVLFENQDLRALAEKVMFFCREFHRE